MTGILSFLFFSLTWIIPVILVMCFAKRIINLPLLPRFFVFFALVFLGSLVGLLGGYVVLEGLIDNGFI